jgi:hypothetical protein
MYVKYRFSPLLVTVRATALPVKAVAWKAVATLRDATAATHATACGHKHATNTKMLKLLKSCNQQHLCAQQIFCSITLAMLELLLTFMMAYKRVD